MNDEAAATAALVHLKTKEMLTELLSQADSNSFEKHLAVIGGMIAGITEVLWEGRKAGTTVEESIQCWTAMGSGYFEQFGKRERGN